MDVPSTAHFLGGCSIGSNENNGVVNSRGEVFNYQNLYVVDGSIIAGNLSVNPALTITALAEYIMAQIPPKKTLDQNNIVQER